jgi:DNA-binding NarL/FixJ family response regulator
VIRVLVVDDHAVVREGLRSLLGAAGDLECIGTAADGDGAVELIDRLAPDVVVLDLAMPGQDGISVIRNLRGRGNGVRVLVLSSYAERPLVLEALDAGADGYLLKHTASEAILDAVRVIAGGGSTIDPQVAPAVLSALRDRGQGDSLTEREREVLELLRQGHSNKVIARRLRITEGTVKTHVTHILHRVGAADRTQAALWAERHLRRPRTDDGGR